MSHTIEKQSILMQFKIHEGVKNDLNHDSDSNFFYEFCIFDILRENQSAFGSQFFAF